MINKLDNIDCIIQFYTFKLGKYLLNLNRLLDFLGFKNV